MTAAPTQSPKGDPRDGERETSVRRSGADCILEKDIKKMVIDEVTNHLSFWPQADIQDAIAAHVAQRVAEAVAELRQQLSTATSVWKTEADRVSFLEKDRDSLAALVVRIKEALDSSGDDYERIEEALALVSSRPKEPQMREPQSSIEDELRAEIAQLTAALAASRDEAEKAKADPGFGFHWIMARCTEAVEMYEEHVEGYNAPNPPVTTEEAVIADQKAKLTASESEVAGLRAEVEAFKANNRYMRGHTAGLAEGKADSDRLVNVARGCLDYGGGYRGDPILMGAFHHGIQTVINALEAASKRNPSDTQVNALERMGALAPKEGNAP